MGEIQIAAALAIVGSCVLIFVSYRARTDQEFALQRVKANLLRVLLRKFWSEEKEVDILRAYIAPAGMVVGIFSLLGCLRAFL